MVYTKDFDNWNTEKKNTNHLRAIVRYLKEREIWWCKIGINVGFEIDGKGDKFIRPVLVIQKLSADTFWGIPLTKKKSGAIEKEVLDKFYYKLETIKKDGELYDSLLDLRQIRLFDKKKVS